MITNPIILSEDEARCLLAYLSPPNTPLTLELVRQWQSVAYGRANLADVITNLRGELGRRDEDNSHSD